MTRHSRRAEAVRQVLQQAERALTPAEIHAAAATHCPGLGIATVYRQLRSLVANKGVLRVAVPGSPPRYEIANQAHHHHFQCVSCGRVFKLPGCPVHLQGHVPNSFQVMGHELFLYGHCPDCRR